MATGVYYPGTTILTWNMCGRFRGKEVKEYGDTVLEVILNEKQVDLLLGQQISYLPSLSDQYCFVGGQKAFLVYNVNAFRCCDERQFRLKIRDLQVLGKLPYHYLKDQNFTVCKLQSKIQPGLEFLALSWHTDECMGDVRSANILKKLSHLAYNLSLIEEMPIIIGGTFRMTGMGVQENLDSEFHCFDYEFANARRAIRASDCFVTSRQVSLTDVSPLLLGRMEVSPQLGFRKHFWVSPEDIFYFDPVMGYLPGSEVNVGVTKTSGLTSSLSTIASLDDPILDADNGTPVDPQHFQNGCDDNLNAGTVYRFSSLQSLYSYDYNGSWCTVS